MADQSSIWKKEISLGRRKPDASPTELTESVWKKEIRIGRRNVSSAAPVERDDDWAAVKRTEFWAAPRRPEVSEPPMPAAVEVPAIEPVVKVATAPAIVAPEPPSRSFAALDPKFRQIAVLAKLVEQRAAEYPGRVNEWRQMLPRLAEQAEDGVLPIGLEGVVRTLFYELLHVGPNAPNGVEQTYNKPKSPRLKRPKWSPKPAEQKPEQAVKPEQSGLRRELHLPRPKLPKRSKSQPSESPEAQPQPAPAKSQQSSLRRELHLPRLKLPTLSRGLPRPKRPRWAGARSVRGRRLQSRRSCEAAAVGSSPRAAPAAAEAADAVARQPYGASGEACEAAAGGPSPRAAHAAAEAAASQLLAAAR